ncbi:MAG: nucleoside triphosphate pyrophosphohydrolase [Candidatus Methylomirabilis oxygeniifera]|uniref:Protein mazG n=1 Tax=Methylomirabilis oxygeniifera TaxID=671143 RepID=D5MJU2_METO1|nr:MAG: nucleoside triphosphate pyrophosphohydrolase [Candidatus Methylomirabilis oxyfera]CBE67525.1 Protein mazG [Candidatus Methylomirabilis oxyfera]
MAEASGEQFEALVRIMERLRADNGCPWDREQTRETLKPFLIEEAYEVVEAIDEGDPKQIMEELGDLLFQVVFHAQLAAERREFTIGQVLAATAEKMVRRHPHVFGDGTASTAREVLEQWEELKRKERNTATAAPISALDGVPRELPGLLRAQRLQDKAASVGFDWPDISGVTAKIEEELGELREAMRSAAPEAVEEELGDVLFSMVNLARFLNLSAEEALRKSTTRFTTRFQYMEAALQRDGRGLEEIDLEEMEQLWQQAKSHGRS